MASIQAATVAVSETHAGATPGVFVDTKSVIFHLTNGFSAGNQGHNASPAITAAGRVQASFASPAEEIAFSFGFIQFMKVENVSFFYAGRKRSDGSIAVQAHIPPALANPVMLDNFPGQAPFASSARFTRDGVLARNNFRDHPQFRVKLELTHKITGKSMFLFHVIDRRSFLTVFSARDGAGALQHLAFFTWKVDHNVQFNWRNNAPVVASTLSSFKITQPPTVGAPNIAEFNGQLAAPTGPDANSTMARALMIAVTSSAPVRTDNPSWFTNVPPNFFS